MVVSLLGTQVGSERTAVRLRRSPQLEGTVQGAHPALNTGGWARPGRSSRLLSASEGDSSVELEPASKTGGPPRGSSSTLPPSATMATRSHVCATTELPKGAIIMKHLHKLILIRR